MITKTNSISRNSEYTKESSDSFFKSIFDYENKKIFFTKIKWRH